MACGRATTSVKKQCAKHEAEVVSSPAIWRLIDRDVTVEQRVDEVGQDEHSVEKPPQEPNVLCQACVW